MHLFDLPEVIQSNIFALVDDTRSRNAMALVCRRWQQLERATRTSITLRGNVRHLFLLPTCFPSITNLDISLLSPWGYSFIHHNIQPQNHHYHNLNGGNDFDANQHDPFHLPDHVVAGCLRRAFPLVTSLIVYARGPSVLEALVPQWPDLRHVKLVRWHQRPPFLPGSDFVPLLHGCPSLTSLDLSNFYCWTDDIPAALRPQSLRPIATHSLTRLDLLSLSSVEGYKSCEILVISSACPTLRHLLVPCVFDPRYHDFVGDETLQGLASNCKSLATLHLVDHSALSAPRRNPDEDESTSEDAKITPLGLENLFVGLPMLEDLVLDVCHRVRYAGPALEGLNQRCPRIRSLKLGQFLGVCRAAALHLDGVAVCGGLASLSLKNSADLTDASLVTIARGCTRLLKFEIHGCKMVTEVGLRKLTSMLRSTLVEVGISCCKNLDALRTVRALEPIRDRIQRLSIDFIWSSLDEAQLNDSENEKDQNNFVTIDPDDDYEDNNLQEEEEEDYNRSYCYMKENGDDSRSKKCKLTEDLPVHCFNNLLLDDAGDFWYRTWNRLKYLSLWLPVGDPLTPLSDIGFESCPELEEMCVKVEGDCRTCPVPSNQAFGLSSLVQYPNLSKMKLDCGDAIGFLLTAPKGQMDLSLWERFYLKGIEELQLSELDYWPPQDKDMNQRSVSLPAAGLLAECRTLRKLFIHGTAHEHFMNFFLNIPNLRDVQLREDYYPAPENDTSTEMRVDSCGRFEEALNRRLIPD